MPITTDVSYNDETMIARYTYRRVIIFDSIFLLTDRAPEFDSKLRNILLLALHAHDTQSKQSLLHVEAHLIVVRAHDAVQATKCAGLDAEIIGLRRLTHDLHDVVALTLVLHVRPHEVNGVTESLDSGESNVHVLLFAPSTLDHGGQNSVGVCSQALPKLGILGLADETDGDQRGLLQLIGTGRDILNQDVHQLRPLIPGKFNSGDGDYELGGGLAGPGVFRVKRLEAKLLDLRLDFWGNLL